MATKLDIRWTPIENRFITWSYDSLSLYEAKPLQHTQQNGKFHQFLCLVINYYELVAIKISNRYGTELIGNVSIQNYLKCVDIHPKCENDLLFALGLSNGNIKLATFSQLEWEPKPTPAKEIGLYLIYTYIFIVNIHYSSSQKCKTMQCFNF